MKTYTVHFNPSYGAYYGQGYVQAVSCNTVTILADTCDLRDGWFVFGKQRNARMWEEVDRVAAAPVRRIQVTERET